MTLKVFVPQHGSYTGPLCYLGKVLLPLTCPILLHRMGAGGGCLDEVAHKRTGSAVQQGLALLSVGPTYTE